MGAEGVSVIDSFCLSSQLDLKLAGEPCPTVYLVLICNESITLLNKVNIEGPSKTQHVEEYDKLMAEERLLTFSFPV